MEKEIITAFVHELDVIEFDNVVAVEDMSTASPKIEIYLHGVREPIVHLGDKAVKFVEKFTDYIYLKQKAMGLEVETTPQGGDNG